MTDTKLIKCDFTLEELKLIFETFDGWTYEGKQLSQDDYNVLAKIQTYIESAKPRQHIAGDYVMDMNPFLYRCEVCGEVYNENMNQECEAPTLKHHNPAPFVFTSNPPQFQCMDCGKMYFTSSTELDCEGKKNG